MKNKEIDCCTEKKVHEEIVDKTKKEMLKKGENL